MKNYLFLCLMAYFTLSCDDAKDALSELTKFELEYDSEITVPATTIVNTPITLDTPPVTTNSSTRFEEQNTNADLVEGVKLLKMTLTITDPTDGNFDFLEELKVGIKADGLEEVQVAIASDIMDDGKRILEMETFDVELKSYIIQDEFSLNVSTTTDQTINEAYDISIKSIFEVDFEVLGL
ncbi:hypothetical protein NBT05_08045 [Aquimarina sp. ERC-38]|uniref:hypothetical protein n=1 Tax=Aquimarina sp. ERC-38 TaxID=2949996 RepID=UPI002246F94D|nr:hypothetical protein [Aquimarina sp. ERC-38]UZO82413.1 hypothetical protein NBT05_08045 [Aquimarina sp. ERC-38]